MKRAIAILTLLAAQCISLGTDMDERSKILPLAISSKKTAVRQMKAMATRVAPAKRLPYLIRTVESLSEIAKLEREAGMSSVETDHEVVSMASRVLSESPRPNIVSQMQLLRGEAHKNLGADSAAIKDLSQVAADPSHGPDAVAASFLAYHLYLKAKDYRSALNVLRHLDAKPGQAHFPLAQEYLSWALHYSGDSAQAATQLESLLRHFNGRGEVARVERRHLYGTYGLFLASAVGAHAQGFEVPGAIRRMQALALPSDIESAFLSFALALASTGDNQGLQALSAGLKSSGFAAGFAFKVRITWLGSLLNVRNSKATAVLVQELAADRDDRARILKDEKTVTTLKSHLGRAADLLVKASPSEPEGLASVYELLVQLPEADGEKILSYTYNAGELAFSIKRFDRAVSMYRRVADKDSNHKFPDATIKAIAARFEELKSKKMLATEIDPEATAKSKQKLPTLFVEWHRWVESMSDKREELAPFRFEMYRTLYSAGHLDRALKGFRSMAHEAKYDRFRQPAANLVLDTLVAQRRWDLAFREAQSLAALEWPADFQEKLAKLSAQTTLESISADYQAKNYRAVLSKTEDRLKSLPRGTTYTQIQSVAAHSALALKENDLAAEYFDAVRQGEVSAVEKVRATLSRAAMEEQRFGFDESSKLLASLFVAPLKTGVEAKDVAPLRERLLHDGWLAQDPSILSGMLRNPAICSDNALVCGHFAALKSVSASEDNCDHDAKGRTKLMNEMQGKTLARFAAQTALLRCAAELSTEDQRRVLKAVAQERVEDEALRIIYSAQMLKALPGFLAQVHERVAAGGALSLSKKSLGARVNHSKASVEIIGKLFDHPQKEVQVLGLLEAASIFLELNTAIDAIPAPKELNEADRSEFRSTLAQLKAPFAQKRMEYVQKAFRTASESSVAKSLRAAADRAFSELSPQEASEKIALRDQKNSDLSKLELNASQFDNEDLAKLWGHHADKRAFGKLAMLLQDLRHQKTLSVEELDRLQAGLWKAAGFDSEAFRALGLARPHSEQKLVGRE